MLQEQAETVNAVPVFSDKIDRDDHVRQQEQIKVEDDQKLKDNWQQQLKFNLKYDEYQPEFESLMSNYKSIWNGHLGRIFVTKHRIELTTAEHRPVHSPTHRAGPCQRKLEKDEVYKILNEGVAEPANSE